ncbi:hypothetical protein LTR14_011773, partial [Exophiala xenobiotica]
PDLQQDRIRGDPEAADQCQRKRLDVWGTVDPNTMEEIDKLMKGQKGQDTLAARFREQLSTVTGGFGGMSG